MAKLLSAHGAALLALNVALFASFIGIFFFTFGSFIEKLVLRREIKLILNGFIGNLRVFVPDGVWEQVGAAVDNLPPVDTSNDQATLDSNKVLLKEALIAFGATLAVALFVVGISWYLSGKSFSLTRLFGESFGLLLFVAVVEFAFYSLVAANYRSIDANFVKGIIAQNASDFAEST